MITTHLSFIFGLLWFKNEMTTQAGLSWFGQNLGKTLYDYLINLENKRGKDRIK
jgi:hypothetical protein